MYAELKGNTSSYKRRQLIRDHNGPPIATSRACATSASWRSIRPSSRRRQPPRRTATSQPEVEASACAGADPRRSASRTRSRARGRREPRAVGREGEQHAGAERRIASQAVHGRRDRDADRGRDHQVDHDGRGHDQAQRGIAVERKGDQAITPPQTMPLMAPIAASLNEIADVAAVTLVDGEPGDEQGDGLVAGVAGDAGDDRHQGRERHQLLDAVLEQADHPRGDEGGHQIDREPQPAAPRAAPDRPNRSSSPLSPSRARGRPRPPRGSCPSSRRPQAAEDAAALVDHRRRDQLVMLEGRAARRRRRAPRSPRPARSP